MEKEGERSKSHGVDRFHVPFDMCGALEDLGLISSTSLIFSRECSRPLSYL